MVILRCSEFSNVNTPELQKESTFTLFPNPAGKLVNINITVSLSGAYTIEIQSLEGILVQNNEKALTAGFNHLELVLPDLAGGIYIISIKGNDFIASQKMLVE
jgi:hypothetical protein